VLRTKQDQIGAIKPAIWSQVDAFLCA